MDFDKAKPSVGGNNSQKMEELFEVLKLTNKWIQLRILPQTEANQNPMISIKQHWIDIIGSKSKKEVRIPKMCVGHDSLTDETGECPYCDLGNNPTHFYLVNVLVRSLQDDAPAKQRRTAEEKKTGIKEMGSDSWTPNRVLRIPSSLMLKIQGLKDINKHAIKGEKKPFNVNHAKFGADIMLKHDKNAKGADQYQVQLADKGALTEEELGFLVWQLDETVADAMGKETLANAKKEIGRMEFASDYDMGGDSGDDDDDEDMGRKRKPAAKSKSKAKDDAFGDDDEDDEEDERPARGKSKAKPAPKGKKRPSDDEDEDEEDFDMGDDDEDEEEEKPARGKSKAKPAPKKRSSHDDDDDEEDDEEDSDDEEDDEEDERPARGKSKAKPAPKKRASRDADEDDDDLGEDDEEDEDEEDDERPTRGRAKPKPAPKKRSSRDEDDEEDEEEDEEDERPSRGKSKAKPASKSKKRSSDDDEEDDDIPF